MGKFEKGAKGQYELKDAKNGLYAFIIDGEVELEGERLNSRDGMGIREADRISLKALSDAQVLLMELPMDM